MNNHQSGPTRAGDVEALDLWDAALQRPAGTNQHTEGLDNVQALAPVGNTEARALRKLRADAPGYDLLRIPEIAAAPRARGRAIK